MKFGRYLRDSLIPEWRKAYIDYRGLKKLMKRIAEQEYAGSAGPSRPHGRYAAADALAAQGESVAPLSPMSPLSPRSPRSPGSPGSPGSQGKGKQPDGEQTPRGRRESEATDATEGTLRDLGEFGGAVPAEGGAPPGAARLDGGGYEEEGYGYGWKVGNGTGPGDGSGSKGPVGNNTPRAGVGERDRAGEGTAVLPVNRSRLALSLRSSRSGASASAKSNRSGRSGFRAALGGGGGSRKARSQKSGARIPLEPSTLSDLLHTLTPAERSYFDKLDTELDKVSTFYNEREREARERAQLLLGQLEELKEHREAFYAAYPKHPSGPWTQRVFGAVASRTPAPPHFPHLPHLPQGLRFLTGSTDALSLDIAEEREALDPHGYVAAKRRLKKALQEYYRGLELLDNYRVSGGVFISCLSCSLLFSPFLRGEATLGRAAMS
ncbi:hypothetical protein CALCODRAFT_326988 [Calocera cornea HHB12733]|uniref:SPX domain-containing protein n=1 Tax=Calocera cornea HHB12733 TaxID=1353952 RepID=A0A165JGW3_9BASI|nr:hypothetical protein CALCODRAFT_326988 [Calocera cornea HHB12733]